MNRCKKSADCGISPAEGGEGFVSRSQVARIADDIGSTIAASSRCSDRTFLERVTTTEVMNKLRNPQNQTLDNWDRLRDFTAIDVNDFAADITEHTREVRNEVHRRQIQEAVSRAKSRASEAGGAGGFESFFGSLSASFAEAESEARSNFEDVLDKLGISVEWQGKRFIPKSVTLYRKEDLNKSWSNGVRLEHRLSQRTKANYSILLGKENWLESVTPSPIDGRDILKKFENLEAEVKQQNSDLVNLHSMISNLRDTIKSSVRVGIYEIEIDQTASPYYYDTRIIHAIYPIAVLGDWQFTCLSPMSPGFFEKEVTGREKESIRKRNEHFNQRRGEYKFHTERIREIPSLFRLSNEYTNIFLIPPIPPEEYPEERLDSIPWTPMPVGSREHGVHTNQFIEMGMKSGTWHIVLNNLSACRVLNIMILFLGKGLMEENELMTQMGREGSPFTFTRHIQEE